jgi:integrase/recombinase XerD
MAIQFEVALQSYLEYLLIERGLSQNSIVSYKRDLEKFHLLAQNKGIDFASMSEDEYSSLIGDLTTSGLAPSSVNRFTSSLKGFYKYCALEFSVANPLSEVSQFKTARKLPKALSVDEITRLIDTTINPEDPRTLRDRAILEMLYGTGARVAELIGLDINDITTDTFDGETITIVKLRGKGSKERLVPLGKYALDALDNYLVRLRPALVAKGSHNERALFLNSRGSRLSRQSAWSTVLKAAEASGLQGRVSPHVFRHSYATHLLDGGADIRVVQELLGHASVTTTQIYTLVTIDKVRESYSLAHPRA